MPAATRVAERPTLSDGFATDGLSVESGMNGPAVNLAPAEPAKSLRSFLYNYESLNIRSGAGTDSGACDGCFRYGRQSGTARHSHTTEEPYGQGGNRLPQQSAFYAHRTRIGPPGGQHPRALLRLGDAFEPNCAGTRTRGTVDYGATLRSELSPGDRKGTAHVGYGIQSTERRQAHPHPDPAAHRRTPQRVGQAPAQGSRGASHRHSQCSARRQRPD